MTKPPFGRAELFSRVRSHLAEVGPQLVLVAGAPRSGRTTLLTALAQAAASDGFAVVRASDGTLVRLSLDTPIEAVAQAIGTRPSDADADAAAALAARAPVVLLVDGYRPGPGLARWFVAMCTRVMAVGRAVVIVVADDEEALGPLSSIATACHELGELDADYARSRITAAGAALVPALTGDELEGYVERLRGDPAALEALVELFELIGSAPARP